MYDENGLVLIYPYWNVKTTNTAGPTAAAIVLIYPYWNVKYVAIGYERTKGNGFNLSILECKGIIV